MDSGKVPGHTDDHATCPLEEKEFLLGEAQADDTPALGGLSLQDKPGAAISCAIMLFILYFQSFLSHCVPLHLWILECQGNDVTLHVLSHAFWLL